MIATERLYLTSDRSRVVREGDPKAHFLLAAKGQIISKQDVEKYGLNKEEAKPVAPAPVAPRAEPSTRKTRVPDKVQTR